MDGWNTSLLLGWLIFRGKLLVSGRVHIYCLDKLVLLSGHDTFHKKLRWKIKMKVGDLSNISMPDPKSQKLVHVLVVIPLEEEHR